MVVCACDLLIIEGRELVMNSMTIIVTCDPPCTHDTLLTMSCLQMHSNYPIVSFFSVFSLAQLYIAGLPLRSCWTTGATYLGPSVYFMAKIEKHCTNFENIIFKLT